jgi:hypothetical protein
MSVKRLILAVGVTVIAGGATLALAAPSGVSAKTISTAEDCSVRILTFPTWFNGLVKAEGGKCVVKSPDELNTLDSDGNSKNDGLSRFIWRVALNVIDIALQLVGYIAVIFILIGGFNMITSSGSPDGMAKARKSILNAVIGLVISVGSVGLVNLIMSIIK